MAVRLPRLVATGIALHPSGKPHEASSAAGACIQQVAWLNSTANAVSHVVSAGRNGGRRCSPSQLCQRGRSDGATVANVRC